MPNVEFPDALLPKMLMRRNVSEVISMLYTAER